MVRVNIIPTPEGEELVARLQRSQRTPSMEQLGMTKEMLGRVQNLATQKSGMIVINGPAGSGKTTTIYSMLSGLASPERKIVTAEDPIELRLPYVSHTAVTKQTGFAPAGPRLHAAGRGRHLHRRDPRRRSRPRPPCSSRRPATSS